MTALKMIRVGEDEIPERRMSPVDRAGAMVPPEVLPLLEIMGALNQLEREIVMATARTLLSAHDEEDQSPVY